VARAVQRTLQEYRALQDISFPPFLGMERADRRGSRPEPRGARGGPADPAGLSSGPAPFPTSAEGLTGHARAWLGVGRGTRVRGLFKGIVNGDYEPPAGSGLLHGRHHRRTPSPRRRSSPKPPDASSTVKPGTSMAEKIRPSNWFLRPRSLLVAAKQGRNGGRPRWRRLFRRASRGTCRCCRPSRGPGVFDVFYEAAQRHSPTGSFVTGRLGRSDRPERCNRGGPNPCGTGWASARPRQGRAGVRDAEEDVADAKTGGEKAVAETAGAEAGQRPSCTRSPAPRRPPATA